MSSWMGKVRSRRTRPGRFGWVLALIALCVQLAAPAGIALLASQLSSPGDDEFAALLNAHALCLSGNSTQPKPESPIEQDRSNHSGHFVPCCFWHVKSSPYIPTYITFDPIAFDYAKLSFSNPTLIAISVSL